MPFNIFHSRVTTNVTLVTTAETVVRTLSGVTTGRAVRILLRGWCQLTTGTNTTGVIPRIRRGVDATGTLVDEGNTVTIGAAAGSTEQFSLVVREDEMDASGLTYVFTLEQVGATANGTCLVAALEAIVDQ